MFNQNDTNQFFEFVKVKYNHDENLFQENQNNQRVSISGFPPHVAFASNTNKHYPQNNIKNTHHICHCN